MLYITHKVFTTNEEGGEQGFFTLNDKMTEEGYKHFVAANPDLAVLKLELGKEELEAALVELRKSNRFVEFSKFMGIINKQRKEENIM